MCQSLIVLSSGESDVDPWSSKSEELLSPFARMDDETSEDDLDYFSPTLQSNLHILQVT